ncbi:MAG: cation:proton antiporter [Gemmatimonadales bacterium]|nr:MAG: cation:proton antiporter [Gemmatimonadales bacterium]
MPSFPLPITDPVLIVAVAVALFLLAPMVMQIARLPGIIGVILAGALVGPNALNLLDRDPTIILLGTVGLLYLMFMAGIEIDLHGFRRHRNRSLYFGALTFLLPQVLGIGVGLSLGYGWATSILMASMFASHTLVAYPVAMRLGIGKNRAVTPAVGGTIITDTAALLVLAVIAASTRGTLDTWFWVQLVVLLSIYVLATWLLVPRLGRWFFRNEKTGANAEYLFVLTALFVGAYFAEVVGVEAIVGAFLVGLALNPLLPEGGILTNRIHFVGEAFFIPFFLLSVGMLVDVRVFLAGPQAWMVMGGMTVAVVATKGLAALAFQRIAGFTRDEGWTVFGLTVPQAAATLAATLIGVEVGLFDEAILNGAIAMILVTCIVGPTVVARFGREVALTEELAPAEPGSLPERIMVSVANPGSGKPLLELGVLVRDRLSPEPLYPLTVVPDDPNRAPEFVATAQRMLREASGYTTSGAVPVTPVTRVDHNFASGIARGATEVQATTLVLGWERKPPRRFQVFGTVLDQVLELSRHQVLVARIGPPLNTTERIVVVVPEGTDHMNGFPEAVRTLKRLAYQLGAPIKLLVIGSDPGAYVRRFERTRPEVDVEGAEAPGWSGMADRLATEVRADDLVVIVSARRGQVAWSPELDQAPRELGPILSESIIVLYPSDMALPTARLGGSQWAQDERVAEEYQEKEPVGPTGEPRREL